MHISCTHCCSVLECLQYVAVCCVQKVHVRRVYRTHYRLADGWFILKQQFIIQQTRFCAVRICDMFLVSKCRGESDLSLCMTPGLAKRMPLCSANFRRFLRPNTCQNRKSALPRCLLHTVPISSLYKIYMWGGVLTPWRQSMRIIFGFTDTYSQSANCVNCDDTNQWKFNCIWISAAIPRYGGTESWDHF